jgi:hypothetical protein
MLRLVVMKLFNLIYNIYHLTTVKTKSYLIFKYLLHVLIFNYYKKKKSKILPEWNKTLLDPKYKFTMNNITQSVHLIDGLKSGINKKKINIIIVGCFEGMSTIFFLNNFNIKELYCVDIWDKKIYKKSKSKPNLFAEKYFDYNIKEYSVVKKINCSSKKFFKKNTIKASDIIYLDASPFYLDVFHDARESWKLLNKNGYLIFNSILYRHFPKLNHNNLGGINIFLNNKNISYELISISSNMLIIKKIF